MIPQDQHVAVRREVLCRPLDEASERRRIGHGTVTGVIHKAFEVTIGDLIDLVDAAADDIVPPLLAAAGEYDKIHLVRHVGVQHLLQIVGSHSAIGLQVRTAHVDHDSHSVFAVAKDLRELISGFRSDLSVELSYVGIRVPSVGRLRRVLVVFLRRLAVSVKEVSQSAQGRAASAEEQDRGNDDDLEQSAASAAASAAASDVSTGVSVGAAVAGVSAAESAGAVASMRSAAAERVRSACFERFSRLRSIVHI